jgi:hypothetical protein
LLPGADPSDSRALRPGWGFRLRFLQLLHPPAELSFLGPASRDIANDGGNMTDLAAYAEENDSELN